MAGSKILIVDDEVDFIEVMRIRLEASGYEVISATDGAAGLEAAHVYKPACIILDIGMPHMDGFSFVTSIKQVQELRSVPIIVVSARGHDMRDMFEQEGVWDYLVKPFDTQKLLDIIQKRITP